MQQILRVQAAAQILQNQTSKWIIYRSFRLNTLSMNLSAHDKLRSVSYPGFSLASTNKVIRFPKRYRLPIGIHQSGVTSYDQGDSWRNQEIELDNIISF